MKEQSKILVTGGMGFIGSNFVRSVLGTRPGWQVVNLDALTYAGNPANLKGLGPDAASRHTFVRGDIRDTALLLKLFFTHPFDAVIHFAAESHVDHSILGPAAFVETNVLGSFRLLETARQRWAETGSPSGFRFLHVSTDEVYGDLGPEGAFREDTPYQPSSPYSASKAASDHFVRAYHRTYGLPALVTNCSNNHGPFQFPEKLIPLMILNIVERKPLPVYGQGGNVRDWLYVLDHCEALLRVLESGQPGETYNIGGGAERTNLEVVHHLCDVVDRRLGRSPAQSSRALIQHVTDRPGHDRRYAIDCAKIRRELGWVPGHTFEEGIDATVSWYLENPAWVAHVRSGEYQKWMDQNYGGRDAAG
ncbi:MAG: dTDP-glucose 4,6-dehydratase [Deferrisomatales bacterium]|nr:dTDP-glucose 4,6-dehydratase [Deferrisomatales bacterium]